MFMWVSLHAHTQNRKNPGMILPIVPGLLNANWRLKGEVDHMDRLSSSQGSQEDIFEKG